MKIDKSKIRNFSIIAHIDHGKSTLADRLLEMSNTVAKRDMKAQLLDQLDLERERGITIKLNAVQINYVHTDGVSYLFHLIDTPGHVDFAYEVSRSLAACDGALLVVDAAQGVQPQTIANTYLALDNDVFIAPVINKVDLPAADIERTKLQIEEVLGINTDRAPLISAKTGLNIDQVFKTIIEEIPAPSDADDDKPLKALIFDSYYDTYRGAILYVALKNGTVKVGDKIRLMAHESEHVVTELGIRTPVEVKKDELVAGEVGWIAAGIKSIKDVSIGDTVTLANDPASEVLPGYRVMNPMVFCGFYPIDTGDYIALGEAIDKIMLEDSSLQYEKETSQALGFGFRLGFLGLLHLEIVQQRLEREYGMSIIATAPSVKYNVYLTNKTMVVVENPSKMPDRGIIEYIEEPIVKATIIVSNDYVGPMMTLCHDKRGVYEKSVVIDSRTQALTFYIPLGEIVFDFFNEMKSLSKGFASFDYEYFGYEKADLVKMAFLLNGDEVDALSVIIDRKKAYQKGKDITERLKSVIPRQNFEIPIQAAIGGKVIARETVKAYRKNVIAKCSGGDIGRKKKLLQKQKEGKSKMKQIGSVELPPEAFVNILDIKKQAEKITVKEPKKKQHRMGH